MKAALCSHKSDLKLTIRFLNCGFVFFSHSAKKKKNFVTPNVCTSKVYMVVGRTVHYIFW